MENLSNIYKCVHSFVFKLSCKKAVVVVTILVAVAIAVIATS